MSLSLRSGARRSLGWVPVRKSGITYAHGQIRYGKVWLSLWDSCGLKDYAVLDGGWSAFRTMLQYKCDHAGAWFDEVNEAYSTQTCSRWNKRTGPKGLEGLGVREWLCSECGTGHHRDINAAKNILAAGHGRLASGIPVLTAQAAALEG